MEQITQVLLPATMADTNIIFETENYKVMIHSDPLKGYAIMNKQTHVVEDDCRCLAVAIAGAINYSMAFRRIMDEDVQSKMEDIYDGSISPHKLKLH